MGDLLAMVERLREARELERLRAEVAGLRARWDDHAAVSAQAARLGMAPCRGPSSPREPMRPERFRLFGF
jgi:hypothetical protein